MICKYNNYEVTLHCDKQVVGVIFDLSLPFLGYPVVAGDVVHLGIIYPRLPPQPSWSTHTHKAIPSSLQCVGTEMRIYNLPVLMTGCNVFR